MPIQTQGFNLSALPIAPSFPSNLGEFDASRARRQATEQVGLYKRLANLTAEQKATQAQLALSAKKDETALNTVEPLANAAISKADYDIRNLDTKSQVLQEGGKDIVRSGVLSAKADVGKEEAALGDQERVKAMREQSKGEIETVRRRFAEAANLADHDAEANELEQIRSEHPWIATLPEYKDQARLLDEHIKTARQRAADQQKAGAANERAQIIAGSGVERAKIGAGARTDVAKIAAEGKPAEFERESNNYVKFAQLASEATDQDDKDMYEERARVAKQRMDAINAPKGGGAASVQMQKAAMGARHAVDAAEANSARMTELIDRIIPRATRSGGAGVGSILSVVPESDARALKADIETLKANIGFNELNALRQASPTGGALGQVSERELHFLQNVLASLDTSLAPKVLQENLVRAKKAIQESAARLKSAYEQDFPAGGAHGAGTAQPPTIRNQQEYDALPPNADYLGPDGRPHVKGGARG